MVNLYLLPFVHPFVLLGKLLTLRSVSVSFSYNCEFPYISTLNNHLEISIFAGGAEGHVSRDCTMEAKPKSCYKCGQEGHIVSLNPTWRNSSSYKSVVVS